MPLFKYLIQYRFRDMAELIRNEKADPLPCHESMQGKLIVLTGATAGIGLETARYFAERGADLICINRNPQKAQRLLAEFTTNYGIKAENIICDFASMEQVRACARTLNELDRPIDVLIHNAGVYHTKKTYSQDGIEMVFQVNHLSSFLLNYLLKDKLTAENRARIIYVNSEGHRFALAGVHLKDLDWRWHFYTGLKSYGAAKTAQLLSMQQFADLFSSGAGGGVTINAMHPGNVKSDIGNNNGKLYRWLKKKFVLSSAREATVSAQALYYLAAAPELKGISGQFFNLTTPEKPAPHARDRSRIKAVWDRSLELCGLD
ncbi:MAG: SDR family NAD(P)-dependent oxidoreductase [Spirochaetaceae bacterium]|nr:MAG: SDR family NAD(P)-dependent oxidoreductase [Spirochaetaceae bacterium]